MRPGLMRTLLPSRIFRANNGSAIASAARAAAADCSNPPACLRNCRCFARVQDLDQLNREVWFSSSAPRGTPDPSGSDNKPPDERTLQLGKSRFGRFLYNLKSHTDLVQLSKHSTTTFQRFYKPHSLQRYSHLASPSTSSLRPIHTSRLFLEG
jgi:hypothetical protein